MRLENCRERDKKARSTREASSRIVLYRRDINSGGEKTNVVIPFCRPFLLLFRILFFTTIFSTIFSRSKGGRKGATAVYRQRRRATSKRGIEGGGTKAEGTWRESKRKVTLSLSFATAFGQRISRLRRGGESRSEPR